MPIEIKELHIRVALTSPAAAAATATAAVAKPAVEDKECIIAECVEQVLQILRNKAER